jgi:hypothetical protein
VGRRRKIRPSEPPSSKKGRTKMRRFYRRKRAKVKNRTKPKERAKYNRFRGACSQEVSDPQEP